MEGLIPGLPDDVAFECLARVSYDDFPAVSSVCRRWRRELYSPEFHRHRRLAGLRRTLVACPGIFTFNKYCLHVYLFDPTSGHSFRLPPLPNGQLILKMAAVGLCLVAVVGIDIPFAWEIYIYDFLSGHWRQGAAMPGPPRAHFAFTSDGERWVFLAGGMDMKINGSTSAMAYDVAEDMWVPMPDMAHMQADCYGVIYAGTFYVYGIPTSIPRPHSTMIQGFDLATWKWCLVDKDAFPANTHPRQCSIACDGNIYVCTQRHLQVKHGSTWHVISELPSDIRDPVLSTWKGDLLISGHVDAEGPEKAYTLALGDKTKRLSLREANEVPKSFWGFGTQGCWLKV